MKLQHIALAFTSILIISNETSWAVGLEKPVFWSGKYSGIGGAAISSVKGAESLYFNPSGLSRIGTTTDNEATLDFSPTLTNITSPLAVANTTVPSKALFSPIGSVMVARQLSDGLGIGLGAYAAGGLGADYGNGTLLPGAATPAEIKSSLSDIEVALGVGYQITPMLSIGAAWRASFVSADFAIVGAGPLSLFPSNNKFLGQTGSDYSGFKFGAEYGSEDGSWGLGAAFRTSVDLKASGTGTTYTLYGTAANASLGNTQLKTTLPLQLSLGGHFAPCNLLKIFLQYDYTQYVDDRSLDITIAGQIASTALDWKNRHSARIGGEYAGVANWPIRFAYVYTSQVTPTDLPAAIFTGPGPAHSFVLGTGTLLASNLGLDAALEYTFENGTATPNQALSLANAGDYNTVAYALHTGLSYKF